MTVLAAIAAIALIAIAIAIGVLLDTGHRIGSERELTSALARLSHVRIAPRQASSAVPVPAATASAATRYPIIGTNDGAGWGAAPARTILRGDIGWDRVELSAPTSTLAGSLKEGFKVLGIVGNIADGTPLAQVSPARWGAKVVAQIEASKGIGIAEAGNESYLKAGVANPVRYGRMYLDAVDAMQTAGIRIPLLFNMTGDIPLRTWSDPGSWSEDARGGGWLREAVTDVPGLAAAILANGVSIHPYGRVGESTHDDWGIDAVAAEEAVANTVLGSIPPVYITEIGFALHSCGASTGACSELDQARKMQATYEVFLADPHIYGIWWYQSHDDPTGDFGFLSNSNHARPAFKILSTIGAAVNRR